MQTFKLSLLVAAGLAAAVPVAADDAAKDDPDATHCVSISNIRDIQILDNRTLFFRMRAGDSYVNELPHECPGLKKDDKLMYRSSVGQLCDLDIITILDDWGFGFAPGASCGLGMFHPASERDTNAPAASTK